ncbi:hypothetical protein HY522_05040 [bacterium]|nr:hypothetical protein [bacterium]
MSAAPMRVVTNSDLDAITSCVLLRQVEAVTDFLFIDLDDIRRGWKAQPSDIAVNIPFIDGCGMWFDHHDSNVRAESFAGRHEHAPSAARVVYNHYAAAGRAGAFARFEELLAETDKVDSAAFTREDILNPERYVLISHLIASQPVRDGTVEENRLMIRLFEECPDGKAMAEAVLAHPVFKARADQFLHNLAAGKTAILRHMIRETNVLVMDQRPLDEAARAACNNKFLPYVLFEGADVLVRVKPLDDRRTILTVGFNIFSPDNHLRTHIGHFLKQFGGGGHPKAGGCSVAPGEVDGVLRRIVDAFRISD